MIYILYISYILYMTVVQFSALQTAELWLYP